MNIFNLIAKLTLDSSEYESGLKKSEKSASTFADKSKKIFKGVATAVGVVVTAITAAAAAMTKLATSAINYADEIDKTSQKLGLSAESYQTFALAAQMAGAEVSDLQMGIRQLSDFTKKLEEGNADAIITLNKLGISASEFSAQNTEKQLLTVINALQGMTDQTEKARLAQQFFGSRTYQELMPLLNQEQGSVEALGEQYKKLGIIISDDVVKQGAKLNDQITVTKATLKSVGTTIMSEVFPSISTLVGGFQDLITGVDGATDKIADGLFGIIDKVLEKLPDMIETVGDLLVKLVTGIISKVPDLVPPLLKVVETLLVQVIKAIPDLIASAGDIINALVIGLLQLDWIKLVVTIIETIIELSSRTLPNLVFNLIDILIKTFTTGKGLQMLGKLGTGIVEILVNSLIAGFEGAINSVIHSINLITGGLSSLWEWIGIPAIPKIPNVEFARVSFFEKGGMLDDIIDGYGTVYGVAGEGKNPEVVAQGSKGTGVATVEMLSESVYDAIVRFFGRGVAATLRIGDKDFDAYLLTSLNNTLRSQGRNTIDNITRR